MVNGDSLCRWPLEALLREHRKHRPAATLLVARNIDPRPFGGGVALEGRGIVAFRPAALAHAAARRHWFSPEPRSWRARSSNASRRDRATSSRPSTSRSWRTERRSWRSRRRASARPRHTGALSRRGSRLRLPRLDEGVARRPGAEVGERVDLRRTVVEAGARVATGARLRDCLVLPGATVGAGARLRGAIVGPGAEVAPGVRADATLFTHAAADQPTIATPIR
ncbi:MAG: hypothetical protein R2862_01825 [Thermoanaerobaculia bacterium]